MNTLDTLTEYLLQHGMLDMVVPRKELRATLSRVLRILTKQPPAKARNPQPRAKHDGAAASPA